MASEVGWLRNNQTNSIKKLLSGLLHVSDVASIPSQSRLTDAHDSTTPEEIAVNGSNAIPAGASSGDWRMVVRRGVHDNMGRFLPQLS